MQLKRMLTPSPVVSLVYWWRFGAKVSPRSEVDLTDNLTFGSGCIVGSFCKIKAFSGPMVLGDNVDIGTHCFLHSDVGGLSIGDHTMVGPLVSIIGTNYSYASLDRPIALQERSSQGIRIGKGAWIGAGAMILDGADIGDNVIVTPNSVVAARIAENSIVQGNPADVIFTRR